MKLSPRFQVLFLAFLVLGVYYTALFADASSLDDLEMMNMFLNRGDASWLDFFRPGSRFYYRPVLMLTFLFDYHAWGFLSSFMHLENVLLHLGNTLFVFALARKLFQARFGPSLRSDWLPLMAGILFAVHPINTESVNWISGRTDPLASFFVLGSFLTLLTALQKRNLGHVLLASLLFLLGVMSKEVMVFFFPVAVFLLWRWPGEPAAPGQRKYRLLLSLVYGAPLILGAGAYLLRRVFLFGLGGDEGIRYVLEHFRYGAFDTVRVFFKVVGFYVKKLFFPLPLDITIIQVSDHYVWLGIAVCVALLWLMWRNRMEFDFLLAAVVLLLPAVIIALTSIAWTPLAERYLYLPSAFATIGCAAVLGRFCTGRRHLQAFVAGCALLAVAATTSTVQRNLLWQDGASLFRDSVAKNPEFGPARNQLALNLLNEGREAEARKQLEEARSLDPEARFDETYLNTAFLMIEEGDIEEALAIMDRLGERSAGLPAPRLRNHARVYEAMLRGSLSPGQEARVRAALAPLYQRLFSLTGDPFMRYRQAHIVLSQGDKARAAELFREASVLAGEDAYYKQPARKLAENLSVQVPQ